MGVYNLTFEKKLLEQIAAGDQAAFKLVFDTYKGKIYTFVLSFIHSPVDAEEIVQEAFVSLWQQRDKLLAVEHPRNYIYTLVRNKTLRYIDNVIRDEKAQRVIWANMQMEVNYTQEAIEFQESMRLINQALSMLPEQKQKIFRMCRNEGLSHEEIAAQTGLSKSRVKNIMVEVLKYLKVFIADSAKLLVILLLKFF
ncbi:RNA polymerase sigma-70 factor [Pedobacter sp. BS3]|uniref:RNA polymerase sigma factor n=1 Tax=Pedobacter sp. BS3 TaxID=2567937 RepID=UPI0011ED0DF2|nr:RNA polymerase sigma-70 factor [Pedobacter sp. BS3]TZF82988.1 RNA polymerase sigma-70 factor [Pedobacter sp. BS3]